MAAEEGHAKIISLLTNAGAQLEAKADLDVSAWLVVGDCIVHPHRSRYMESISSQSIAVTTHNSIYYIIIIIAMYIVISICNISNVYSNLNYPMYHYYSHFCG